MQSSIVEEKGLKRKITLTIPLEEVKAHFLKSYRQIQKTAHMPGFRKGKVPLKILEKNYKNQAYQKTIESLFDSFYPKALSQLNLRPAGPPEPLNMDLREGKACQFLVEIEVHPQVRIEGLESLSCPPPLQLSITEEDVDSSLKDLKESFAEWADRPSEGPLKKGDFCDLQIEVFSQSGENKLRPSSGVLEVGADSVSPGFDEHLIGLKLNEKREFDFLFPKDHQQEKIAGQKLKVLVCLKGFKNKILPDLKLLAKNLTLKSVEELRDKAKQSLQNLEEQKYQEKIEKDILHQMMEKNPLDIPQVLLQKEIQRLKTVVRKEQGQKPLRKQEAFLNEKEFEKLAKKNLHAQYLISELILDLQIKISEEEIKQSLKKSFPGTPLKEAIAHLKKKQSWESWIFNLERKKALGQLIQQAQNKARGPVTPIK